MCHPSGKHLPDTALTQAPQRESQAEAPDVRKPSLREFAKLPGAEKDRANGRARFTTPTRKRPIMNSQLRYPVPHACRKLRAPAVLIAAGLLSGAFAQPPTANLTVVSDSTWRSVAIEPVVVPSLATWVNPAYDDSAWPNTILVPGYPYPPGSYIPGTSAKHIWHNPHATYTAWFRKSFIIPGYPGQSQAIVRVDDAYDFHVNGVLVGSKPTTLPAGGQTYDITPYLREGLNLIAIKGWDILTSNRALLFDAGITYVPNEPPVANAGSDQTVAPGKDVFADGSGTSDDHTAVDALSCLWTIESAPSESAAVLSGGHTLYPKLTTDLPGDYMLKLVVLDSSGLRGSDEMTVTVSEPMPNGSFEQDLDGWSASGNVTALTSPTPTDGQKLACFNSVNTVPDGVLSRTFATAPGVTYMVGFDVGILAYPRGSQAMRVDVTGVGSGILRATQTVNMDSSGGGKTTWKSRALYFTAYDDETTVAFHDVSATTRSIDLLLDRVNVTPVGPFGNGGFESGLSGWAATGNVVASDASVYPPTEGSRLAAFNRLNTVPNGVLTRNFKLMPGMAYVLAFDMGVLAYNTSEQSLQVSLQGTTLPAPFKVRGLGGGQTRWETMRVPFTANYDIISVAFTDASSVTTGVDLLLDRVRIEPVSMLANPGFELGFHRWMTEGNVTVKSTPPYAPSEGSRAAVFNSGNSAPDGTLTQVLWLEGGPGNEHSLLFDMGALAYNTNSQSLQVEVDTRGMPTQSWTFSINGIGGGKSKWATRKLVFTAHVVAVIRFRDVSAHTNAIDLLLDNVRVEPKPAGFVKVPAGEFRMGDSRGDGALFGETPVHAVFVSAFLMAETETTMRQWEGVRTWAATHGYTDLAYGTSKGPSHPVANVSWPDVIKWCNARSEMDGLKPCYTIAGAVYRNGAADGVVCDWSANGFRLPSEAEWEKAARGGMDGYRFPWGDLISHHHAAIREYGYPYEAIRERILINYGHTSPVGTYPANRWGIHDMSGNVWEHCWDKWIPGYYAVSPYADPRGPDTSPSPDKMIRGGGGGDVAEFLRVSKRAFYSPDNRTDALGFRMARSL
jgi:formylglycine-generating enzyme required for sulfatase activity